MTNHSILLPKPTDNRIAILWKLNIDLIIHNHEFLYQFTNNNDEIIVEGFMVSVEWYKLIIIAVVDLYLFIIG